MTRVFDLYDYGSPASRPRRTAGRIRQDRANDPGCVRTASADWREQTEADVEELAEREDSGSC